MVRPALRTGEGEPPRGLGVLRSRSGQDRERARAPREEPTPGCDREDGRSAAVTRRQHAVRYTNPPNYVGQLAFLGFLFFLFFLLFFSSRGFLVLSQGCLVNDLTQKLC